MFLYKMRVRKLESESCVRCSGNTAESGRVVSGGVHWPLFARLHTHTRALACSRYLLLR